MLFFLQSVSKWIAIASVLLLVTTHFHKDKLPEPGFYQQERLVDPVQESTFRSPFWIETAGQRYRVTPLFDYTLEGVIVSYHDADAFSDIWHHDRWQDFINVRDLCVIWGDNVVGGVYQEMTFENDSWTCWAHWPDARTRSRFRTTQLSNNHLLVDNEFIESSLMSAEPGDHIRMRGQLVRYENPANGFQRGTSTRRDDTGNGACETLYLEAFSIVSKANAGLRTLRTVAMWCLTLSVLSFLALFFVNPIRRPGIR